MATAGKHTAAPCRLNSRLAISEYGNNSQLYRKGANVLSEQIYPRPASLHALVCRLIDLGYMPVPIPAGCKGPTIQGWQNLRMTKADVPSFFNQEGMLVGVLHKNNCFIDIDVYDPELATIISDEAKRRFPGALERVGQYPKTAIVLGLDECGYKVHNTIKAEKDQYSAQVEIRTLTRQAVAYGKHPDTGENYKWVNGPELWETPINQLPIATKAEMQAFRDWADAQIRDWAGVEEAPYQPQPQSAQLFNIGMFHNNSDERASEEQFLEALKYASPHADYDTWVSCLMGIHDFYGGAGSGLQVAHQWSADYHKYSAQEVDAKWRSFEVGKGVGYKTVFHLAKQSGADMSAIARIGKPQVMAEATAAAFHIATSTDVAAPDVATVEDGLEWFSDIEPSLVDTYMIKGVLAADTMSVVYGPSNSGKTFFALDLAFHIATGTAWRGLRVKPAGVLYLAAEGGRGVLNRVVALKRETGITDVPMAVKRAGLDLLHSEADLQAVYDLAQEVKKRTPDMPLMIVIDTLSRIMAGGDENSAADMTALIRNIDAIRTATNAHVMLVHHTGKDTARGARGHSSLRAATDTEIEVQNEDGERAAQVQKQRDYQGGETFAFTLKGVKLGVDQDGDDVTSCVIEATDTDEFKAMKRAKSGRGKNQKIIMETFDQMIGEGLGQGNPGGVGMPQAGQFWAVDMHELRRLAQAKMNSDSAAKLFRTAWEGLTGSDGLFVTGNNLAWRIDRRKGQ